jgi:hypothetical protein
LKTIAWLFLLLLLPAVSATAARSTPPVSEREWKAVTSEWNRLGRLSLRHTCAELVVARAHITRKQDEELARALSAAARSRCTADGDPWAVVRGMSNRDVASHAGAPVPWLSGPHCWYYRKAKPKTNVVGRTICFDASGHVVDIDTALTLGSLPPLYS